MLKATEDQYEVVANPDATPRCFLLEVDGDAMVSASVAETIPRGSLLLCDPDQEARAGHIVVALHPRTSEPVVRQLVADGGLLYLRAYNTAYPMLEIAGSDAVIARAVEVITRRSL
jgi:SOS-response transcriptional repressor LexA